MFYNPFLEEDDDFYDDIHLPNQRESFKINDKQISDTLVLHPQDITTNFLKTIYHDKKWDVINDPFVEPDVVEELINTHERIICLGHGSPAGLFGGYDFLIHDDLVSLLKDKLIVGIWCYASEFMRRHNLRGFFSGMFISDLGEACMYGITDVDQKQIDASNDLFASILGKYIDSESILEKVKSEYHKKGDPVISFNHTRFYYR